MANLAEAKVEITADAAKFHAEAKAVKAVLESLTDKHIKITIDSKGVLNELREIGRELRNLTAESFNLVVTPTVSKASMQSALDGFRGAPPKVKVTPDISHAALQDEINRVNPDGDIVVRADVQFAKSQLQSALRKVTPKGKRPLMSADVQFNRAQIQTALTAKSTPPPVVDVHVNVSDNFKEAINQFRLEAAASTAEAKKLAAETAKITRETVEATKADRAKLATLKQQGQELINQGRELRNNAKAAIEAEKAAKKLAATEKEISEAIKEELLGRRTARGLIELNNRLELQNQKVLRGIVADVRTIAENRRNGLRPLIDEAAILGNIFKSALNIKGLGKNNINEFLGNAIAGELLLNQLNNIFSAAIKVRKVALQMGLALATAFAVGAQGAGLLLTTAGTLVSTLQGLAGLGIIAVGVKLQLERSDVQEAKQGLVDTFKEVGTRVSNGLGDVMKGFFADTSQSVRNLEPLFQGFFDKVNPSVEKLGKAFNTALNSKSFANIVGKLGDTTKRFLDGFAQRLPRIVEGIDKIGSALTKAKERIREAFGPSVFDRFTIEGFIAGLETLVRTLEIAGPGIKAFKSAFGELASGIKVGLQDVAATVGDVGPELFGAVGPIAKAIAVEVGQIASAFIRLASEVFPKVQASAIEFVNVFGDNFASSIAKLADPLAGVINGALQLGTALAPLLDIFANIIVNLEPVAIGFLNLLNTLSPLALAIANFAESFSSGFGATLGILLTIFNGIATVISTVLTPAINFLANSGLAHLAGVFAAIVLPIGLVVLGMIKLQAASAALQARLAGLAASSPAAATGIRLLTGSFGTSAAASAAATRSYVQASIAQTRLATAARAAGGAGRVAAAGYTAAATSSRLMAAASINAAAGSRLLATGQIAAAAATRTASVVALTASGVMRGLGAAFRFALGPIGLILIGIEVLIGAFSGLTKVVGGVIKFLSGDFSEGLDQMGEGIKEAASGIKDHFLGTGDEVEDTLNSELSGVDPNTEELVGKFSGIKVDIAAGLEGTGDLVSAQLKEQFSKLDLAEQIKGLQALKEAGKAFTDTVIDNIPRRDATANILEGLGLDGLAAKMRETGFISMDELRAGIDAKIPEIQAALANNQLDAATAAQILNTMHQLGVNIPPEILAGLQEKAGIIGPGLSEAITKGLPETIPAEAEGQNKIAQALIKNVEDALAQADLKHAITRAFSGGFTDPTIAQNIGSQISGMLALAFSYVQANPFTSGSGAAGTAVVAVIKSGLENMPADLVGGPLGKMLTRGFQALVGQSGELSNQIVASISLAFDTAFGILGTEVLPQKLTNMFNVAFASAIATNVTLGDQITETMSLAFDSAFLKLPEVLGPKITTMLGNVFTALVIDPTSLSTTMTTLFTTAFTTTFTGLPEVISPPLKTALTNGVNSALVTFGTDTQTAINDAFTVAFSGVAEAVNAPLNDAFATAGTAVGTFATTLGTKAAEGADGVREALEPLRTDIPEPISEGLGEAIRVTQLQLDSLVQSVKNAEAKIRAIDFYGAGYQIGARLAAGIRASTADLVVPAADDMGQAVRDRTPNSPAKKGPLSGIGDPLVTGGNVVKRFVMGMRGEFANLVQVVEQMAALAQANGLLNNVGGFGGAGRGNGLLNGFGTAGAVGGNLVGTNRKFGGRILKNDTSADLNSGNVLQIRPGTVNISVPGTNDPREFINSLSKELMTNCTAR